MAAILCIEDETDIRELLDEELSSAGYEVVSARNGSEALEKLTSFVPDIIVSDISMPEMDGYELLESVRSQYPQLADAPFLFLTAFSSREEELKARTQGVDDFISKPVDFDLLLSVLASRLEQVARMRNLRNKQFVKLYNALTSSAPSQTPTEPEVHTELVSTPSEDQPSAGTPETSFKIKSPRRRTVYGTIFRFPNLRKVAEEAGTEYHGLWERIRGHAIEILKVLLFDEDTVSSTAEGELFVSHRTASLEEAEWESGRLSKALQDSLIEDQKKGFEGHGLPREMVEHALILSQALFEITIPQADVADPEEFKQAILDIVKQTREDDRSPSLLTNSMRMDDASLRPLALVTAGSNALPVRFFDFDEQSKRKMRASFAFFSDENRAKAGYLIDTLSLELLDPATRQISSKDVVVADVNFDTLASETFAPIYARKFKAFTEKCGHPVMINARSIPPGITDNQIKRLFNALGKYGDRRCVQIQPHAIEDFINSRLPVNCIVVSYPELKASGTALELFAKVKPELVATKTLLILRGIPNRNEIKQFNRYGFDGYAVEAGTPDAF